LEKKRLFSTSREVCGISGISAAVFARRTGWRISAIPESVMTFAAKRRTPGRRTRSLSRPGAVEKTLAAGAAMLLSRGIGGL